MIFSGAEQGIAYAILAALVWGTYIFAIKSYFVEYPPSVFVTVAYAFAFLWYLPLILYEQPSLSFGSPVRITDISIIVGAIVLNAIGFLTSFRALSLGDVSYVAPISKITPVFVLPLEVVFLHEHLTPIQVGGVVLATFAVYLANYRSGSLLDPFRLAISYSPGRLALLTAVVFAVVDFLRRVILQEIGLTTEIWVFSSFAGMALTMVPFASRRWASIQSDLPKFVVMGGLAAAGEHVTALAFDSLSASIASPILNTQAVVAVLLGGFLLREDKLGLRLFAAGVAVAGVGIITVF